MNRKTFAVLILFCEMKIHNKPNRIIYSCESLPLGLAKRAALAQRTLGVCMAWPWNANRHDQHGEKQRQIFMDHGLRLRCNADRV